MIIEVDKFKEKINGYNPNNSEDFHVESGQLADKEFIKNIKESKYKRIILMAGGTASGKSEFAQTFLVNRDQLTYDGTLKSFHGFKVKNDKIKNHAKHTTNLKVVYILPINWQDSLEVFLSRERKMKFETFFQTHVKSALTVSQIFRETSCRVEVYLSSFNKKRDKMMYQRMTLGKRSKSAIIFNNFGNKLLEIAKSHGVEIDL